MTLLLLAAGIYSNSVQHMFRARKINGADFMTLKQYVQNLLTRKSQLKIKKLKSDALLPVRANPTDAGLDLYALHDQNIAWSTSAKIETGIAIALPKGTVGLIFDRSSLGIKGVSRLAGVIDQAYRGEIIVALSNTASKNRETIEIKRGDKIAQLLIVPILTPEVIEVDELDQTDRGIKGFGSSGR